MLALRRAELHLSASKRKSRVPCPALPCLLWQLWIRSARSGKKELFMAGENTGRKPEKQGGAGMENAGPESAEASPRSKRMAYTCWNDGASNFVEPGWEWFTCWRCGALVYTA